jgi:hypothetical protein
MKDGMMEKIMEDAVMVLMMKDGIGDVVAEKDVAAVNMMDGIEGVDASISQFVHAITANIVILIAAATGEIAVMSMEDVIAETIALRITGISVITAMTTNYENFLIVYIQTICVISILRYNRLH